MPSLHISHLKMLIMKCISVRGSTDWLSHTQRWTRTGNSQHSWHTNYIKQHNRSTTTTTKKESEKILVFTAHHISWITIAKVAFFFFFPGSRLFLFCCGSFSLPEKCSAEYLDGRQALTSHHVTSKVRIKWPLYRHFAVAGRLLRCPRLPRPNDLHRGFAHVQDQRTVALVPVLLCGARLVVTVHSKCIRGVTIHFRENRANQKTRPVQTYLVL